MSDSIFKREVFVTYKEKASFYGVLNLETQSVYPDSFVAHLGRDRVWVETLLDDPDLASIQFTTR